MPDQSLTDDFDLKVDNGVALPRKVGMRGKLYSGGYTYTYLGVKTPPGPWYGKGLIMVKNDETGHVFDTSPIGFDAKLILKPDNTDTAARNNALRSMWYETGNTDISSRRVRAIVKVWEGNRYAATGTFWTPETFGEFVFNAARAGKKVHIEVKLGNQDGS